MFTMMGKTLKLEKIVKIEKVGKKHCYDFNTKTGCFFANGFLVHNCADIIILLHWPYHYAKNGDKNKFTLNVAKNRNGRTGWIDIRYKPENYWFYEEVKENADWQKEEE